MFDFVIKLQWEWETSARQDSRNQGRRNHGQVLSGSGLNVCLIDLGLGNPLGLCSSVLEPYLDLGFGQLQLGSKVCSLSDGEVALLNKLLLQLVQLVIGEGCSGFSVCFVLSESTFERKLRELLLRWTGLGSLNHWRILMMVLTDLRLLKLLQKKKL